MRGFVGIGQSDNIEAAVSEATGGLRNADLLILLAPYDKAEKAASFLLEKYPSVPMIGTTGASVAGDKTGDSQIIVIGLAGVTVSCGLVQDLNKAPLNYIKDFESSLKELEFKPEHTICMEFITGNEEKTISTLSTVLNRYNISLCGGSSYGTPLGEKPLVIYNGKIYYQSCVYAFIKNNAGKIRLFKENIYEKLSERAHFATLVDSNTKTLFQLDDEPAHEVYTRETGVETENIADNMINNPLARMLGDDTYLIQTKSLDINGVMFNGKAVYENDSIYIMQPGDYRQIHADTIAMIKGSSNRISFVFGFDSINRLKFFTGEDYLQDYLSSMSELGTYVSLLGDGQQYNNQHINQTLVCAVFE